ncbi:hypothetical protein BAE44_0025998 [Dichanthelium oligosanthes]|uniref:WPP domain-containing protein n=1 Tax=Dichanthelium oligosanthes TaxID=888268 RepID=A0A1E5UJC5_9POAL|nr:hypothetical protein BAE44_0025998 [Dichanthelium oligosanthes]
MSNRRRAIAPNVRVAGEGRRRSLTPLAEAVNTPLSPFAPSVLPSGFWPPSQSTRDAIVLRIERMLVGPNMFSQRYGAVPGPEANLAAAAIEAEAFAAAGATLASNREQFEVFQAYCKGYALRVFEFFESRAAAASGPCRNRENRRRLLSLLRHRRRLLRLLRWRLRRLLPMGIDVILGVRWKSVHGFLRTI